MTAVAGCFALLPQARDPRLEAQHREPLLCPSSGRAPSYPDGFFSPSAVLAVEPFYFVRSERGSQQSHLLGATLMVRAPPGLTALEVERLLNCHAVRSQLGRAGEPPVVDDPYWVPGHVVHVSVEAQEGALRVQVEAKDVAGAQELFRRATAFASAGRAP